MFVFPSYFQGVWQFQYYKLFTCPLLVFVDTSFVIVLLTLEQRSLKRKGVPSSDTLAAITPIVHLGGFINVECFRKTQLQPAQVAACVENGREFDVCTASLTNRLTDTTVWLARWKLPRGQDTG